MSFDIGDALSDGFERTGERNGLMFVGVFLVISAVASVFAADLLASVFETVVEETELELADLRGSVTNPLLADDPTEPLLGLSASAASLGLLVAGIVQFLFTIAATRTFTTDETETIPGDFFTRRLGWVLLNTIVGGVVFGLAVSIGFVFFIVPGLFLLVSLFFWWFVVVVEDENFVTGFQESWSLASGNRWALLVLGVLVFILSAIINTIGEGIAAVVSRWAAVVVLALFSAPLAVFTLATAAQAYRQLRDEEPVTSDPDIDTQF